MPDNPELRITTRVDLTGLNSGMQDAQQAVTDASAQMQAAFSSVGEATTALKQAQAELADILKQAGGSINENNAMWGLYQETLQRVADAQAQVNAANSAVADSTAIVTNAWHSATTTSEQFGAASRQAALSLTEQQAAIDSFIAREESATAVTRALEASIAALVDQALTVPPAMQAAADASYMAANAWSADTITSEEFGAATQQVTLSLEEQQAAMREFAAQAEADAAATQALVDAAFELIAVNTQEAAVTDEAAAATNRFGDMQAYVAARSIAMAAGLEREGFLFGMMARSVPALAAVMDAVFPVAVAASFAYVIAELVDEFAQWYQRTQELKKAMSDLIDVNVDLHNQNESATYRLLQQEAAQAKLNGQTELYQKLVQQMVPLTAASVSLKIPQKDLDDLHNAGLDVRTLINELQNAHHLGDLQDLEKPLQSATDRIQQWIAKTSAQIKQDTDRAAAEAQAAMGGGVAAGAVAGTDNVDEALKKRLATAQQLLQTLQQTQTLISTEAQAAQQGGQNSITKGISSIGKGDAESFRRELEDVIEAEREGMIKAAEVGKQALADLVDADQAAAKKMISSAQAGLAETMAADQERARKELQIIKERQEEQQRALLQEVSDNQNAQLAKITLAQENAQFLEKIGLQSGQTTVQQERQFADEEYQVRREALERRRQLYEQFSAADPQNPRYIDQLRQINSQVEQLQQQHQLKLQQIDQQSIIEKKKTYDTVFSTIQRTFDQSAQGIIMGTETITQAFRRMGSDMLASFVDTMAQMGLKWIETHLLMRLVKAQTDTANVVQTQVAATENHAITAAANVATITSEAAVAAAKAYAAYAEFPPLASAMSAEAFSEVMALTPLASAAGGYWRVPDNMLANIHRDEMVLPSNLASGMRTLIENNQTGGGGGSVTHNWTVNSVDARSFEQMLRANRSSLSSILREMMRKGEL